MSNFGEIVLKYKEAKSLSYRAMSDAVFAYYPGEAPTRQTFENWAKGRNHPDAITLAIIANNAEGTWICRMCESLSKASREDKIKERLEGFKETP